jgi:hypothetical protein
MDSKILLGKILQRFCDQKISQVENYNAFGYIAETKSFVIVTREKGKDTKIPFSKMLIGIEAYQQNPNLYNENSNALRKFGITHVNSPVWSLLHLLTEEEYL